VLVWMSFWTLKTHIYWLSVILYIYKVVWFVKVKTILQLKTSIILESVFKYFCTCGMPILLSSYMIFAISSHMQDK
jgi:hypothetical protein